MDSNIAVEQSVELPNRTVPDLKRKREEIANSESEDELGSDADFKWLEEDLDTTELLECEDATADAHAPVEVAHDVEIIEDSTTQQTDFIK